MESDSTKKFYYLNNSQISNSSFVNPSSSNSFVKNSFYINTLSEANPQENFNLKSINVVSGQIAYMDSVIDKVSQWFLSKSSMTNKKLQKLCYYTYCWFIVFFNDVEAISEKNTNDIKSLCSDNFQAWIHGPVSPRLYSRYKEYGWHDIPKTTKPEMPAELESLLEQVWEAYGKFTADELENISHQEYPWIKARKGYQSGDACSNEISDYDILRYYSNLG